MRKLHFAAGALVASATVIGLTAGTVAAPKTGCPNESSGWTEIAVEAAAPIIWEGLLDQSPWPGGLSEFTDLIRTLDRNGDGNLCLSIQPSEDRNPNSHWFGVDYFTVIENNANASNQ